MIDANRAAIAVRMHWGIENKLHYTRDVTLREE
jgi:predicted transposase YbfD/YdcC